MSYLINAVLKTIAIIIFISSSALYMSSCATTGGPSPQTTQGVAVGAAVGAIAGSLIDQDNSWRGAMIGGLLGGVLGGSLTEISQRAASESAREGRPVVYQSNDGFQRVEAAPVGYDEQTRCHKVRERIWQKGELVRDEVKEVCESEKTQPGYY